MRQVDVAVVGGGPAGIAAAIASAEIGASTILIDEHANIGGQLRWRIGLTLKDTGGLDVEPGPGLVVADTLAGRLSQFDNLTILTGTVAWGLFDDNVIGISNDSEADEIKPDSVILATGSTDIALPFPGWTLPGVMTARAAQTFMHVHRVLPGRTWVILGDGEEADELQGDLERAGVDVIARSANPDDIRASGTNRLTHVEIGADVYEADALAIALGRQPDAELALHAQAKSAFVSDLGGFTVHRDESGRTSEPGVFIAGDAAGIGSLGEVIAEGRLAGLAAAGASTTSLDAARRTLEEISSDRRKNAIANLWTIGTGV